MPASTSTLLHSQLADIPKRFPNIDVALLHLGGTRIPNARFGVLVTLDARRGVEAVPIHTDDWSLFSSSLWISSARCATPGWRRFCAS